MPRKDQQHDNARKALESDGWQITHDPMTVSLPDMDLFIDLGAERFIGASKGNREIAVEIKTFGAKPGISVFYGILGQVLVYRLALLKERIDREVWLAIPEAARISLFERYIIKVALEFFRINLIVFDPFTQKILQWEKH
ncbi:MAG TPA: fatty-acid oxidation protein subunit alpha [Bacteroidetes bacterium]|nr:fatty-acid oxidation protein subunit alpha [Bacteroidota bacterium]